MRSRSTYSTPTGTPAAPSSRATVTDYTKAIEINPGYANAYLNRGGAFEAGRDYDLAGS